MFSSDNDERYVSKEDYEENVHTQIDMSTETLRHIREISGRRDSILKLEFFFYTDEQSKAELLAERLRSMKYELSVDSSADETHDFCISGWSTDMQMNGEILEVWVREMCELGYECDCEFDGWGTIPDQNDDNTES
ncbi:MAG: hypothetical protein GF398_08905 [Chitinivibrionales bacterium]|nr:hypothetical protein [Chitinivibrionales bacterium]